MRWFPKHKKRSLSLANFLYSFGVALILYLVTHPLRFHYSAASKFSAPHFHDGFEHTTISSRDTWFSHSLSFLSHLISSRAETLSVMPQLSPTGSFQKENKTLLVISTCNEVAYSLNMISTLQLSADEFDVLFVDDASDDGTVNMLRKLGFYVIVKPIATGLTSSWNIAYTHFLKHKYKFIIFTNNDVLVPKEGIKQFIQLLEIYPFMTPATNLVGAGWNSQQALINQCPDLPTKTELEINEPSNFQRIQYSLDNSLSCKKSPAFVIPSVKKFGGFFFGLRFPEVRMLEYSPGVLFDANNVIFGQEEALLEKMVKLKILPAMTHKVFIYHYKSVTVKKSGYQMGKGLKSQHSELKFYHPDVLSDFREAAIITKFADALKDPYGFRTGAVTVIAFAVEKSERGSIILYESFALDIVENLKWRVRILDVDEGNWYALRGVDILIVMTSKYNVNKIHHSKLGMITIALVHNQLLEDLPPWIGQFDFILATTEKVAIFLNNIQPFIAVCSQHCPEGAEETTLIVPVRILNLGKNGDGNSFELRNILSQLDMLPSQARLSEANTVCHMVERKHQVCMIARTYSSQKERVQDFIASILDHTESASDIEVRLFLLNTDADLETDGVFFSHWLRSFAEFANKKAGRCHVHVLNIPFLPLPNTYGYDATDWALNTLLEAGGCTHFMFTNGDNFYYPQLLPAIQKQLNQGGKELIAWDFKTHHPRKDTNIIKVELERKLIDLGSFIVSAKIVQDSAASFLPKGSFSEDLFARDWHFISQLKVYLVDRSENWTDYVSLIHELLFSHN